MKIKNNAFLLIIGLGLVAAGLGFISKLTTDYSHSESLMTVGLFTVEITSAVLLLLNGTFKRSRYFRLFKVSLSLLFLAVMLRILHLPFADAALIAGYSTAFVAYLLHYLAKKPKDKMDTIKLAWGMLVVFDGISSMLNYGFELQLVTTSIILIPAIDLLRN